MITPRLTPDEAWCETPGPTTPYNAAMAYAAGALAGGDGRTCLVIGSPLAEAQLLQALNWTVQYVDIRPVPPGRLDCPIWRGDALALPFADATFDAISSTCVLCHVGTGRYGDQIAPEAEAAMLAECRRVLRPGGRLVMMTGPCYVGDAPVELPEHRVTTVGAMLALARRGGWMLRNFSIGGQDPSGAWSIDPDRPDYLCVTLEPRLS